MIRHTQLHTEPPGPGAPAGDCWRTAIACLLDVPILEKVPHFVDFALRYKEIGEHYDWYRASRVWVRRRTRRYDLGYFEAVFPVYADPSVSHPYVILDGPSPRGDWLHAVIADATTGEIVWDPHPSRAGLADGERGIHALVEPYPLRDGEAS